MIRLCGCSPRLLEQLRLLRRERHGGCDWHMNKWQLICPLVAFLVAGIFVSHLHLRNQRRGFHEAVERHLGSVLNELQRHQEEGRFPPAGAARSALQDEVMARKVHINSLFGTDDLLYNPSRPEIGGSSTVLGVRLGNTIFAIQANREVKELSRRELEREHLMLRLFPPHEAASRD